VISTPPEATETPLCPVCGLSGGGLEVGNRGRNNWAVRNIACDHCALIYQSPRPSRARMLEYAPHALREHDEHVGYARPDGSYARPGEPAYEIALRAWYRAQAGKAAALGETKPGDRVLEVGCRDGRTLAALRDEIGIEAYGIEADRQLGEQANQAGIACFIGELEDYAAGELPFDQIQSFDFLEKLHDPMSALIRLRSWLKPGGRLVIEVPNVYQPYGLLEEHFFQTTHLTHFSPSTLNVLLHRAGYSVLRTIDQSALLAVATREEETPSLPLPFHPRLLPNANESAIWVADRLKTYDILEQLRVLLLATGPTMELLNELAATLKRPGFIPHTVSTVTEMVNYFVSQDAPRAAIFVAVAASLGPYPSEVCERFQGLARALQSIAA
jgi:SAM-dependent methyltransferase